MYLRQTLADRQEVGLQKGCCKSRGGALCKIRKLVPERVAVFHRGTHFARATSTKSLWPKVSRAKDSKSFCRYIVLSTDGKTVASNSLFHSFRDTYFFGPNLIGACTFLLRLGSSILFQAQTAPYPSSRRRSTSCGS